MTLAPDPTPSVAADDLDRRIIEPDAFVADVAAFVDVRLPGSEGKASYSFIGPGVSQNPGQTVNLTEPHGFNIGAASMPHGAVNNAHMHFTAEVFICTRGHWRMTVGEHAEQQLEIGPGTIFSVPTWVFRGFENLGGDDGWLFTVLGGDETGGIIWAPSVLRRAAETGLYLGADYTVRDATAGDPIDDVVPPLGPDDLGWLRSVDDDQLARRAVGRDDLCWSSRALLSHVVDGHDTAVAPVIGFGISEDRDHIPPIAAAHGFGVEWLRVGPGQSVGTHRLEASQVALLVDGDWRISLNDGDERVERTPAAGSVVSVPRGAWRDLANDGDTDAHAVIVTGGDARTRPDWHPSISDAALDAGWVIDADGYVAPAALARRPT